MLKHARAVFLELGLKATSAEVARRAGVSEGLLFKRWGNKRALFEHAMQDQSSFGEHWLEGMEARVGQGALEAQLHELAQRGLVFMRKLIPLVIMSFSHLGNSHNPHSGEGGPFESRLRLERYFAAEQQLGRLRADVDPRVAASLFTSMLFNRVTWEMVLGPHDPDPLDADLYIRGAVNALLHGLSS